MVDKSGKGVQFHLKRKVITLICYKLTVFLLRTITFAGIITGANFARAATGMMIEHVFTRAHFFTAAQKCQTLHHQS